MMELDTKFALNQHVIKQPHEFRKINHQSHMNIEEYDARKTKPKLQIMEQAQFTEKI